MNEQDIYIITYSISIIILAVLISQADILMIFVLIPMIIFAIFILVGLLVTRNE